MATDFDIGFYFLIILYPVVGLLAIEIICRGAKISSWIKLMAQAVMCLGLGLVYLTIHAAHWLTGGVLIALAIALFYQAKLSKLNPEKAMY